MVALHAETPVAMSQQIAALTTPALPSPGTSAAEGTAIDDLRRWVDGDDRGGARGGGSGGP